MQNSTPAVISVILALTLTLSCLFSAKPYGIVVILIGNAAHSQMKEFTRGHFILHILIALGRRIILQGNVIMDIRHRSPNPTMFV